MAGTPVDSLQPGPEFFEKLPTTAGVYLMRDRAGRVIYVGKAKNLRNRVRQYFRPGDDMRFFVAAGLLGRHLVSVETVVVENEKEALLLENHLIKKHQPRFNVKLRDDKQYLVLRVAADSDYPRVEVVRNIKDDGARYFGPYHSASSCRETLRTVNRYFQLRTCSDHVLRTRKRVCLQYQIKRCPGPCVYPVDPSVYREQVDDVMMFLAGKNEELIPRLRERMWECAENEEYEAAAQLRDSIRAVEKTLARQDVVQDEFIDQDVFGLWRQGDVVEAVVLFVRSGKLVGRRSFREREQEFPDARVLSNFVQQYYATGTFVPDEVLVPIEIEDSTLIADWLGGLRGRKVQIRNPRRGQRTRLIALANKNAEASALARVTRESDARSTLEKVQRRLSLRNLPRRIDCFDIAHVQGTDTVASMVVFIDGEPDRTLYRKFKVRTATNDDFSSMYEVITRRFRRAKDAAPGSAWERPDLLLVDGGKGQLGSAVAALRDLGVPLRGDDAVDIAALAKERDSGGKALPDRVFLRDVKDAVPLRPNTAELFLLARLRDEAHRVANTFHKESRKRRSLTSALDKIPGIGATRRRALLRHFGSVKGVRNATVEELAEVRGMTRAAAIAVRDHFDAE